MQSCLSLEQYKTSHDVLLQYYILELKFGKLHMIILYKSEIQTTKNEKKNIVGEKM